MHAIVAFWRRLIDGFWFVPGSIAVLLAAGALLVLEIDRRLELDGIAFAFGGDASAARIVLSTIAGSLITVAGLTFSITIVVLTLISSQYTPRAIRSFLADRLNQTVAGTFVGIFAYCLIVLGAVRSEDAVFEFVPVISVSIALVLGLVALALLVAFIHHMGKNIQASEIGARIGRETLSALDNLYPEPFGESEEEEDPDAVAARWRDEDGAPGAVAAETAGYLQQIALDGLPDLLERRPLRLHVPVKPGDFITPATTLLEVWPRDALEDSAVGRIRGQFTINKERDLRQDAEYGLRQLADVALKALSPGVNDPTTAVDALAYAVAALERLAARSIPAAVREDDDGQTTVAAARVEFADYLATAVEEVAHYAASNVRVVTAVLGGLGRVARAADEAGAPDRVDDVLAIAEEVAAHAHEAATTDRERTLIERALADVAPSRSPERA